MRIIHTCLRYPPATGGVETYVHELVERTRTIKDKRDVRVLTSKMKTHGPISELAPEQLLDDPVYVQRLHHAATPILSYPRLQALSYYLGHHRPDIIHGYSFWYQPADIAARYAQKHKIPFIFHPMYYQNRTRTKPIWQLYQRTYGRRTFAAADVTVVISPHEQSLIEQANLPTKRFELIPPGIDLDDFSHQRIDPFLKRGISGPIVLTVSRLAAGKGLDDAIAVLPRVAAKIPDVQLVIVGEDFGARSGLLRAARQERVGDRVHILGKLNRSELIGAYQHAKLLLHPSHHEAFGIVLAEAQAAGTPVIARDTAAIPYVAPHNVSGHLFTTSEQMVLSLIKLLDSPDQTAELAQSGRQHVENNFQWNRSIKKLVKLYDEFYQSKSAQHHG